VVIIGSDLTVITLVSPTIQLQDTLAGEFNVASAHIGPGIGGIDKPNPGLSIPLP